MLQLCELCHGQEHQTKEGWIWGFFHPCVSLKMLLSKFKKSFLFLDVTSAETEALQRILMAEELCSGGQGDTGTQELFKGYKLRFC